MTADSLQIPAVIVLLSLAAATAHAQPDTQLGGADAAAPATADSPAALDDPWSAVEPQVPEREGRTLQRRTGTRSSPMTSNNAAQAQYSMARTLGALAGVVGLIVLLAWGYRAVSGGKLTLINKTRRPGLIELVSKTSLSARQSLCLVRVGPRLVLIGQSPERLRALDVIDDPDLASRLIGEAARDRAGSSQAEFHDCLEREAHDYDHDASPLTETMSPSAPRINDVRRGLTETIQRIRRAVAQF